VQSELHVCVPGRVERYDHTQQRADVVPLLRSRYADGQVTEPQVITSVPVVFPRSGGASLTMPVNKGDGVMLHFTDASIDEWLGSGGVVTPDDRRRHDLSDCIAVPGLYSFADTTPQDNNTDVRLQYDSSEVRLKPGGNLEITTATSVTVNTSNATVNADTTTINSTTTNNGDVTINGNLTVSGITTTGGLVSQGQGGAASFSGGISNSGGAVDSNGIVLDTHVHSGVESGPSTTGGPQ
jgi:phage baseplate assembly protein gpV